MGVLWFDFGLPDFSSVHSGVKIYPAVYNIILAIFVSGSLYYPRVAEMVDVYNLDNGLLFGLIIGWKNLPQVFHECS